MLYLVATPIGNLSDMSLRGLESLREVNYVASEDTRKTGRLLKHFDIKQKQISFHKYNEEKAGERIVGLLKEGQSVALVSNAGTPGISDPGFTLVRMARREGIDVTMIPGATALVMGIVLSGLPSHSFTFRGFAPRKQGKRRRFLEVDKDSCHTLIFYESPHRLKAFLEDALDVYGDRQAAICKELTKIHEGVRGGLLSELIDGLESNLKGEYTVVISGSKG